MDSQHQKLIENQWWPRSLKQAKRSEENKLNDYYRRHCINFERFLCDRVWECAECAKHATRVEPVEPSTIPIATVLRRR